MKILKNKQYLKYLFWLGPILTIMGLTAYAVSDKWSSIALALLITGLVILGLGLAFLGSLAPGFWGRRSTQVGTNALIATSAVLLILGLINFLAVRYDQRVDLTENQIFTLSPQSQQVVRNLQEPVKVWVFDPKRNPADEELLKNYRRYGSNLQFEFVDPQLKPGLAQKFNVQLPGQVYLEYGSKRQLLQTVGEGERLSESRLTNSIEQIMSDRTDKVYFLQGHGERPLEQVEGGISQALGTLKDKNFIAQPLNLAERSTVPEDASLIVVAGPKRALFPGEVQALRNYLSNGGSMLLMIDPEANSGLDSLLAEWGVTLGSQIVIDASDQGSSVGLGPATPLVTNYGNHPITQDFGRGFSLFPLARPVDIKSVEGVKETALVRTNQESWGESNPQKQPLQFEPKEDRAGPLTLGVALSRKAQPSSSSPTPTPQATTTPGASPTPSPQATTTPGASPTPTAQATSTPGASPSPSPQATTTPGASPTPTTQATSTPAASPSPSPQATTTPGASPTPTAQATSTPGASPSPSPQVTTTPGASPTPTAQATSTPAASPSPKGQSQASPSAANQANKNTSEARLVVYGNSSFAADGWFQQQLNSDVFLNSVSWLSKRDNQALSIRPKESKNRRLNLAAQQAATLAWVALLIMPLASFTAAGVMWWRRR